MEKKNDMLKTIIIAVCAAVAAVGTIVIIAKILKKKRLAVCDCCAEDYCEFDDDDCFCELCEDDITDCCGCCEDDDIEVEITEEADAE